MISIALKMLLGDRAKLAGIVLGLAFASLLITQQGAIFLGIVQRTFGTIADAGYPDIWVMDPRVEFIDETVPVQDTQLYRVRAAPGVASAAPLYKGFITARLRDGNVQTCAVLGIDDETLTAGPPVMLAGRLEDLRRQDGIIVDEFGAAERLAGTRAGGGTRPLAVGDELELNDRRALVVGICRVSRSFNSQPVIYTTFSRAVAWAPPERRQTTFVLAKVKPGADPAQVCAAIERRTGLAARTAAGFRWMTAWYVIKKTGILVNFSVGVALGILVGTAIAGQSFYNFTLDNRRYFSALKAMGMRHSTLLGMIAVQTLAVGFIGYGCGVGGAALFGWMARGSELAFVMPWQLLVVSFAAVLLICAGAGAASILRVLRLQPAEVFRA